MVFTQKLKKFTVGASAPRFVPAFCALIALFTFGASCATEPTAPEKTAKVVKKSIRGKSKAAAANPNSATANRSSNNDAATSTGLNAGTAVAGPITPGGAPGVSGESVSPAEEADYKDAYAAYSRGAYDQALTKLQGFTQSYPESTLSPQVENLQGLSYLLTKNPALAATHFKRALQESRSNPSFGQYLRYNLADAQFEAGQIETAQKTTDDIQVESMDKENRIKVHYLRARIDTKRGAHLESAREALTAGKLLMPSSGRDTRNAVSALLEQNLKAITDLAATEELFHAFEDSTLADQVLFRLGSQELLIPETKDKGEAHLKSLMTRYPESVYYAQAAELTHSSPIIPTEAGIPAVARDTGPVDGNAVGVLLPMKGKFAKFGARTLQGIELAFRIFNNAEPDSKITLVVEDSGEEADTTVRALNKLVTQHHVSAVIGPLLSKGIDQVTQRAEELGVPLISLSRHSGVQSDYIFQAGLTLKLQAREIARYATRKLGIKRFAIVYPRDKIGEESVQRFWDAVEAFGGTVTGVESYNSGETDFRQAVDRLSGLYFTDARSKEIESLARERETNKIKKRTRKTEKYYSLPPVVDYEAVFIPEEPKVAGQIIPTFAYRDVDHIKFLGTSAWNSPELPARAQNYAESAFFLDAFFPESQSPVTRKYVDRYKNTFNMDPSAMDALAYDAAHILETVMAKNPGASRGELRDKLKDIKNFPGVTGRITFQDGQFSRELKILTAKQGKIVEAEE
jgi:branched-chain amino acid transport system substrate-binding protein